MGLLSSYKQGLLFTHAYSASPLCSPTRSAVLTGLSPARTGITAPNCHLPQAVLAAKPGKAAPPIKHAIIPESVTRLRTDYPTIAKSLKKAGYATMFEGGTRVPCVIAWPGVTAAGERTDALLQSEDFYPTLLDGLGLKPEADQTFDGASLMPALRGDALAGIAVFQYFPHDPPVPDWIPPSVSVHRDDWKLIRVFHAGKSGEHRSLLFHLKDDVGETKNLAPEMPRKVEELDALIDGFLASTKAVVPVPNPKLAAQRLASE